VTDLRALARGRDCQIRLPSVCNFDPSTTVLAHYRLVGISGMGLKSPDVCASWACSACHAYVDTHKDDATARAFLEGVLRTQARLIKEGVL
jgi:ferredoxin